MKGKDYVLLNGLSLIATVAVNYLSNSGLFNGNTMKSISDAYFNRFTPAGYAFAIWGVIYLGLLLFVLFTARAVYKRNVVGESILSKIGSLFFFSCLCNSLWVTAWLFDYTLISAGLMVLLLYSLLRIVCRLELSLLCVDSKSYLCVALPFSMYAGWVSLALIANLAALLTKYNWPGFGLSDVFWASLMCVIAGAVNLYMVLLRNMRAFAAVGIWGLLAVAANQDVSGVMIAYTCYGISAALLVAILYNFFNPVTLRQSYQ